MAARLTGAAAVHRASRELRIRWILRASRVAAVTKSVFVVERTEGGFEYTRGPGNDPAVSRQLGDRSPAQAALEEGKAWLEEPANLVFLKVAVTVEW